MISSSSRFRLEFCASSSFLSTTILHSEIQKNKMLYSEGTHSISKGPHKIPRLILSSDLERGSVVDIFGEKKRKYMIISLCLLGRQRMITLTSHAGHICFILSRAHESPAKNFGSSNCFPKIVNSCYSWISSHGSWNKVVCFLVIHICSLDVDAN